MFSGSKIQLLVFSLTAILTTLFSCISIQGGILNAGALPENTILLDFHGSSCAPCQAMRPVIAQLKQAGYPVRSINVDQEPLMADRFGVQRIPCFVMISAGKVVARTEGLTTLDRLSRMCRDGINDALRTRQIAEADYRVGTQGSSREALASYTGRNDETTRTEAIRQQFPNLSNPTGPSSNSAKPIYIPPVAEEVLVRNSAGSSYNSTTCPVNRSSAGNLSPKRLLASSVRIRVRTATTLSSGSGTLIDCRQNRALVLTCGHLFRDYQKENGGVIEVDMFGDRPLQNVPGVYIFHDIKSDLGLISIPVSYPVQTIPVAPSGFRLAVGSPAASSGCDNGNVPTVKACQITTINRFQGPANVQATGGPIEGRSGGGLFSQEGFLVGVTSASIPGENQGLYCFFPAIHELLTRRNLNEIYAQPRNESLQLADAEKVDMPKEMPTRPTMIQWTDLPMSVSGQRNSAEHSNLSRLQENPARNATASSSSAGSSGSSSAGSSGGANAANFNENANGAIDFSNIPGYTSNTNVNSAAAESDNTNYIKSRPQNVRPERPQWPPLW